MNQNITRWPNGFTNGVLGAMLGDLKIPNPATYHMLFDDFDKYTAADWVVSETQAGATQGIAAGDGGLLALVNTAADADLNSIQWAGGTGAVSPTFLFDSTKDMLFSARAKIDDATNGALLMGLAIADTSPIASLPATGMFVYKAAASTYPQGYLRTGGSGVLTTNTGAALSNDTFVNMGIVYSAVEGVCRLFVGDYAYQLPSIVAPGALLAPIISVANGTAAARTLTVDWYMAAKAR